MIDLSTEGMQYLLPYTSLVPQPAKRQSMRKIPLRYAKTKKKAKRKKSQNTFSTQAPAIIFSRVSTPKHKNTLKKSTVFLVKVEVVE